MSDAVQKALQKAASRAAKLAAADTCAEQGELEGAKETKKDKRLKEAKAHSRTVICIIYNIYIYKRTILGLLYLSLS